MRYREGRQRTRETQNVQYSTGGARPTWGPRTLRTCSTGEVSGDSLPSSAPPTAACRASKQARHSPAAKQTATSSQASPPSPALPPAKSTPPTPGSGPLASGEEAGSAWPALSSRSRARPPILEWGCKPASLNTACRRPARSAAADASCRNPAPRCRSAIQGLAPQCDLYLHLSNKQGVSTKEMR